MSNRIILCLWTLLFSSGSLGSLFVNRSREQMLNQPFHNDRKEHHSVCPLGEQSRPADTKSLPPANLVWEKAMFSDVSVCLRLHVIGYIGPTLPWVGLRLDGWCPCGPNPTLDMGPPTCSNFFTWGHPGPILIGKRPVGHQLKGLLVTINYTITVHVNSKAGAALEGWSYDQTQLQKLHGLMCRTT